MVWGWTLNYTKNGGPFIVKRRKNWCVKMCQFGCVSLRIEKVSQISVSVVSSCGAASVNWGYSLLNPAALRSCKVFGSLYLYFWWIPSFAPSCNGWKSACCFVELLRLMACVSACRGRGCLKKCDECRILCAHALHDAKFSECKFVYRFSCQYVSAGNWFLETWLILPVVICLSQRLSHACLSISIIIAKLRMAH